MNAHCTLQLETMDKFKNKFRIASARLRTWDYGSAAAYFITICTHNREHFFGHIKNNRMCLNEIGSVATKEWYKSPIIRPDLNLQLGSFITMPNHIHGIIIIGQNEYNNCRDATHGVSTNKFGPQRKNLASVIRGYKSAVTTHARKMHIDFGWQPRFYDNIIRDQKSYERIQNYIECNPKKWGKDKFRGNP